MEHVVLFVDEAGAKGYSNNTESEPGEFGVMAGYLVPRPSLGTAKADLEAIRERFFTGGKLHIADLQAKRQYELRKDIFACFIRKRIYWVYEAIYVQGFFQSADSVNQLSK